MLGLLEQTTPLKTMGPMELDGAPGDETMGPLEQVVAPKTSVNGLVTMGALKLAGAPGTSGAPKARVNGALWLPWGP